MQGPEELHSAISEVTKYSENHLSVFVLEKGKEWQARETNAPSPPPFSGNAISFKELDNLPKLKTTPLETKACG